MIEIPKMTALELYRLMRRRNEYTPRRAMATVLMFFCGSKEEYLIRAYHVGLVLELNDRKRDVQ